LFLLFSSPLFSSLLFSSLLFSSLLFLFSSLLFSLLSSSSLLLSVESEFDFQHFHKTLQGKTPSKNKSRSTTRDRAFFSFFYLSLYISRSPLKSIFVLTVSTERIKDGRTTTNDFSFTRSSRGINICHGTRKITSPISRGTCATLLTGPGEGLSGGI